MDINICQYRRHLQHGKSLPHEMPFFKKLFLQTDKELSCTFGNVLQLIYYVLKLMSKNAEAPPNGSRFSTRAKTKLKGTQTDFYIREGAFCYVAFFCSVGCRSPPINLNFLKI